MHTIQRMSYSHMAEYNSHMVFYSIAVIEPDYNTVALEPPNVKVLIGYYRLR